LDFLSDNQSSPGSTTNKLSAELMREICLEEGADDSGCVEIERKALESDREGILRIYPKTRSIISIIRVMNRENVQSPPRYIANTEFHLTSEKISEISRKILRRLNKHGIRGVIPPVGFPMDMNRWPDKKIWDISHKLVAVQAGLGHMGINRNVIHPKYGNFILLDSILIDAELDRYNQPLDYNPCIGCQLCVSVCPVGAIHPDGKLDFLACFTHNYREFNGGFQDWVEGLVSSKDVKEYRSKFRDSETASMWQSLSTGANYKSAYCMAVCPAGEDVLHTYIPNRKKYVEQIVKPLREKDEPIYVIQGTRAESVVKRNPNKEARYVHTPYRPTSISGFLNALNIGINPEKIKGITMTVHFEFVGKEEVSATLVISDGKLQIQEGIVGNADLRVHSDSQSWIQIVNGEMQPAAAMMSGKLKIDGSHELLQRFQQFFST
jgi:ferredoxin